MTKLLEPQIKMVTINHLINKGLLNKNSAIINEFTIANFTRRVDLALITHNRLFAFEIKSEADSLVRLSGQVQKYLEFFDKVTVITAPKHTNQALQSTPSNVAIWEINQNKIKVIRRGKTIVKANKVNLIQLMSVSDLTKLARKQKITINDSRRHHLEKILINLPIATLRMSAIKSVQLRYKKSNLKFLDKSYDSEGLTIDDLNLLRPDNYRKPRISPSTSPESLLKVLTFLKDNLLQ